jgi:hypothetical protein
MWRHLLRSVTIVLLAAVFAGGTVPQVVLAATAHRSHDIRLSTHGMPGAQGRADDVGAMPKHAPMPCAQAIFCVAAPAAAVPDTLRIALRAAWTTTTYPHSAPRLRGRTIPPDLSPPIA